MSLSTTRNSKETAVRTERLTEFLDTEIELMVELGCVQMSVKRLVGLEQGSVVELPSRLEEPLQVYANGVYFGRCDLVPGEGPIHVRMVELQSNVEAGRAP
jgi:flagellar motor switch/type III secretory pathway protein FliN